MNIFIECLQDDPELKRRVLRHVAEIERQKLENVSLADMINYGVSVNAIGELENHELAEYLEKDFSDDVVLAAIEVLKRGLCE